MIMEAASPQDLQGEEARWRPGELLLQFQSQEWRLESQEELMFQFESKGKKKSQCPPLRGIRKEEFSLTLGGSAFLFCSGLQWFG